jgi:hypothetical protein
MDDLAKLSLPSGVPGHLGGETAPDQVQHDRDGGGGAGRRAEQGGERAIRGGDDLGAELQDAPLPRILFDNLDALAGVFEIPVFELRGRNKHAERFEPLLRRLQHLADEIPGEINSFKRTPRVALMIPAPIKATSGSVS